MLIRKFSNAYDGTYLVYTFFFLEKEKVKGPPFGASELGIGSLLIRTAYGYDGLKIIITRNP